MAESERGVCRVLCFSPRHDLTLGTDDPDEIRGVVDAWCEESARLGALPYINSVQIFENRGSMHGRQQPASALPDLGQRDASPTRVRKELDCQLAVPREHRRCLLCDYLALETFGAERLIFENGSFAVVVPFWAVWPFETLMIGKRHTGAIEELNVAGARRSG